MSRASIRYAKAILEQAVAKNTADRVNEEMKTISQTLSQSRELAAVLQSPVVKLDDKQAIIGKIFTGYSEVSTGLFRLLFENKRFELLREISSEYGRLYLEMNNFQTVKVTTAIPMDKELEEKVLAKVRTFSDKKLMIENIVDPEIIGGFILRVGDMQFNASVSGKLRSLKKEFSLN